MIEQSVSLASNGVVKVPGYEQLVRFGYTKNRGVYRLAVTAAGEWEGLTIRAFWHVPGGSDPASSLVVDGYVAVPASVTAQPGSGCVTFEGSDGTKTVTSADLHYRVSSNSGTEDGTAPEPGTPAWQQLVDAVHTDATAAEQAKTDAQTAASEAATSAGNAAQSAQEAADSLQELKDGIASGDFKGEPGTSPTVTVQDIAGGHRIVITDATGTSSVDILNGKQGDPGKPGDTGATPELTIGTVEEGDAPSATITGTAKNPVLNLTLKSGAPGKDATVDATLTQSGQAADAKVTGDAISAVKARQNILVGTETGNPIAVDDAFSAPLCCLTVYGKSTQDGTPTPDSPVPIVSAGDGGSVAVALSNGRSKTQTLTLPTPTGLPGIPVTSGGNYTDQSGQQWVCDEVDLEKGVKVQRVGKAGIEHCIVSRDPNWWDASKSYSYQILTWQGPFNTTIESGGPCNRFIDYTFIDFYNKGIENGFLRSAVENVFNISKSLGICTTPNEFKAWFNENVVLYKVLATPIETPLAPSEIAAYKALTAYGPDTVVQASDGAGVKLDYQRDVNLVVKNLEDAIASMTTT